MKMGGKSGHQKATDRRKTGCRKTMDALQKPDRRENGKGERVG